MDESDATQGHVGGDELTELDPPRDPGDGFGAGRASEMAVLDGAARGRADPRPRAAPLALGPFALIAALVAIGLCICSATDALSRATLAPSIWFFWLGIAMIVGPVVYRLCSAEATVGERVALVCLLGLALYAVKVMRDPFGYGMADEFFHAFNAQQIAVHHHLFTYNSLLPVSARYPGLEGATSALMSLTGMSSFGAGLIVIGAARLTLMVALFLLFSVVSGSPRVAGLGAALYVGNSNFLLWGAQFSYESLALPLLVVLLASFALRVKTGPQRPREWVVPIVLVMVAIVITHHLTSYLMDLVLIGLAAAPAISRGRIDRTRAWPFAFLSLALTIVWLVVVASETVGYISPLVTHAVNDTLNTLLGESAPRAPFQAGPGGVGTPITDKVVAYAALAILAAALPFGLVVVWRRHRRDPFAILLALAALGFFGVLALRASPSAWEIANRTDEFLFIGLAFVVGYAALSRLRAGRLARFGRLTPTLVAGCAAVVTVGGAITGWPTDAIMAAPVRISADGRQVDSQTISLGRWVGSHLRGAGFAAFDADSRTILLYGDARVFTYKLKTVSIDAILSGPSISPSAISSLRAYGVRYIVVDRRLRANDATAGYRFSLRPPGGASDELQTADVAAQLDGLPAARAYDSGNIFVYDLRSVQ